jgi:hypothetical protein
VCRCFNATRRPQRAGVKSLNPRWLAKMGCVTPTKTWPWKPVSFMPVFSGSVCPEIQLLLRTVSEPHGQLENGATAARQSGTVCGCMAVLGLLSVVGVSLLWSQVAVSTQIEEERGMFLGDFIVS